MKRLFAAFCLSMSLFALSLLAPGCPTPTRVVIIVNASEVTIGETLKLTATSTDDGDTQFIWTSNNWHTATVDQTGIVTGKGLGQIVITATGIHSHRSGSVQLTTVAGNGFNMTLPTDPKTVTPTRLVENTLDTSTYALLMPGIAAEIRNENGVLYHRLMLPGTGSTEEVGLPAMPFYTLYFAVPRDAQTDEPAAWDVTVNVGSERIIEKIRAYPAQPQAWIESDFPESENKALGAPESDRPAFTINESFYETPGPYPQGRVRSRGFHVGNLYVAEVRVFPALYYPQARRLHMARQLDVELHFSSPNGLVDPVVVGDFADRKEPGGEEWIADFMINAERIHPFSADDLTAVLAPLDRTTLQDSLFELLIVTRPALYNEAFAYGLYKQDQGLRVRLASLSPDTYPDAESIRDFIREIDADNRLPAFARRGPHAMWALCLFGDAETIPPCSGMNYRGLPDPAEGEEPLSIVGTDHLYATVRGDDDLPDFAVGRIPAHGEIEATNILAKIQNYESHTDSPHSMATYSYFVDEIWFLRLLEGTATFTVGSATVTGTGTHFTTQISTDDFMDYLVTADESWRLYYWFDVATVVSDTELVLASPFNGPENITGPIGLGGRDGQDDWEFMRGPERVRQFMLDRGVATRFGYTRTEGPTPVRGFGGIPLADDLLDYAWDVTSDNIEDNWKQGVDGIVLHSDHGARHGWQHPQYLRDNVVALTDTTNGFYPIVFSINCDSGWFDNETDTRICADGVVRADPRTWLNDESFCEKVVRFANGGAVAAVGACRGTDACDNDKLIDGLFAGVYDDYVSGSVLLRHRPASRWLGPAFQYAKLHQYRVTDRPTYHQYNLQAWHLFGDPALRLNPPEPDAKAHRR